MLFTPKVVHPPQPGTRLAPTPDYLSAAYSVDGDLLCVGSSTGAITTWHCNSDFTASPLQLTAAMNEGRYMTSAVPCLRFQPVARSMKCVVAAASTDGTVSQWHATSGRFVHGVREDGNETYTLGYAPTGLWLATAGKDCQVRIYDDERSVLSSTLHDGADGVPAHSSRIQALRWTSSFTLATGGWDRTVQLWDVRQGRATGSIFGPYICGEGLDVRGSHILTASTRDADADALQLWDTRALAGPIATVRLPNPTPDRMPSQLFTAQFSPDGKFIAVGGTSTLLIVETAAAMSARLEVHGEFMPGGVAPAVFSAAWHPRGNAVAAVGASSSLIVLGASL